MDRFFKNIPIRINNFFLWRSKKRYHAERVMILLPRCIQWMSCKQNVVESLDNCKVCGQCPLAHIVPLSKKYGVRAFVATGSLMAREYVKQYKPALIVAIACERELFQGIFSVFPRPVYALINARPHGACKNTQIDPQSVEKVLTHFIG